jgi:hypothetical protein
MGLNKGVKFSIKKEDDSKLEAPQTGFRPIYIMKVLPLGAKSLNNLIVNRKA